MRKRFANELFWCRDGRRARFPGEVTVADDDDANDADDANDDDSNYADDAKNDASDGEEGEVAKTSLAPVY